MTINGKLKEFNEELKYNVLWGQILGPLMTSRGLVSDKGRCPVLSRGVSLAKRQLASPPHLKRSLQALVKEQGLAMGWWARSVSPRMIGLKIDETVEWQAQ